MSKKTEIINVRRLGSSQRELSLKDEPLALKERLQQANRDWSHQACTPRLVPPSLEQASTLISWGSTSPRHRATHPLSHLLQIDEPMSPSDPSPTFTSGSSKTFEAIRSCRSWGSLGLGDFLLKQGRKHRQWFLQLALPKQRVPMVCVQPGGNVKPFPLKAENIDHIVLAVFLGLFSTMWEAPPSARQLPQICSY